jgi:hypothetical protein
MDSDDSNISDHVGDLDIQLYQFEPLCNDESQQERERSTSEDSDIDESSQAHSSLKCIGQRSRRFQKVIINKMGVLGGYFQLRQCL